MWRVKRSEQRRKVRAHRVSWRSWPLPKQPERLGVNTACRAAAQNVCPCCAVPVCRLPVIRLCRAPSRAAPSRLGTRVIGLLRNSSSAVYPVALITYTLYPLFFFFFTMATARSCSALTAPPACPARLCLARALAPHARLRIRSRPLRNHSTQISTSASPSLVAARRDLYRRSEFSTTVEAAAARSFAFDARVRTY